MKIYRITIQFEPARDKHGVAESADHATEIVFEEGKWQANGPVFSRFLASCHEIWQVLRRSLQETGEVAP